MVIYGNVCNVCIVFFLDWSGLDCIGLDWSGSDWWIGLNWTVLQCNVM